MGKLGVFDIVNLTLLVLLGLTIVPVLNGTVIAGDSAVDLGGLITVGAGVNLALDVAVVLTYRVGGRKGVVGQTIVFSNRSNEICGSLRRGMRGIQYPKCRGSEARPERRER